MMDPAMKNRCTHVHRSLCALLAAAGGAGLLSCAVDELPGDGARLAGDEVASLSGKGPEEPETGFAPVPVLAGVHFYDDTVEPHRRLPAPGFQGWNVEVQDMTQLCGAPHVYAAAAHDDGLANFLRFDWIPGSKDEQGRDVPGKTIPQLRGVSWVEQIRYSVELAAWAVELQLCAAVHQGIAYAFIVGNEPNLPSEGAIGPRAYAAAFNQVRALVREQLPDARVLFAGPAAFSGEGTSLGGESWTSGLDWFEQALAEVNDVDGFAIHTYAGFGRGGNCKSCPQHPSMPCPPKHGVGDFGFRQYRDLVDRIVKRSDLRHKRVYITEFNTASDKDAGAPKDCYPPGWIQLAYEEVRNFNACHAEDLPRVHALVWFVDRVNPWWRFALSNFAEPKLVVARRDMQQEFRNGLTSAAECDRDLDEGNPGDPGDAPGDGDDPGCGGCEGGSSTGDPHLVTLDGLAYDFQAAGEFVLAEASAGLPLTVQIRQQPLGTSRTIAINTAVAAALGPDRVALYAGRATPLLVNGAPTTLADDSTLTLAGGGKVHLDNGAYTFLWPVSAGERVQVAVAADHLDVRLLLPPARQGQVRGLLGNFDDDATDDVATRTGTVLSAPTFQEFYASFAESWRIAQAESLFDYAPGENTETFTDRAFPERFVSARDLSEAERAAALQVCVAQGITDTMLLESCILDVTLTGDPSYASSAAVAHPPDARYDMLVNVAGGKPVTATGAVVGDPQMITNEVFAPEGQFWSDLNYAAVTPAGTSLTVDLGAVHSVARVVVQADDNDAYLVESSLDGVAWSTLVAVPPQWGGGMRTRPMFTLPERVDVRYARISVTSGDGSYSVSELELHGSSEPIGP
jgi:hypothetical protein